MLEYIFLMCESSQKFHFRNILPFIGKVSFFSSFLNQELQKPKSEHTCFYNEIQSLPGAAEHRAHFLNTYDLLQREKR